MFECVPPLQRHTRLDILNNCDARHRFGLGQGMGCHALYAMVDHETWFRVMDVEETPSHVLKWIWGALFECVPASGSILIGDSAGIHAYKINPMHPYNIATQYQDDRMISTGIIVSLALLPR